MPTSLFNNHMFSLGIYTPYRSHEAYNHSNNYFLVFWVSLQKLLVKTLRLITIKLYTTCVSQSFLTRRYNGRGGSEAKVTSIHNGAERLSVSNLFSRKLSFQGLRHVPDVPTGLYLSSYLPPDAGFIHVELPSCKSNSTCHSSVTGWHPKRAFKVANCCVRSVKNMFFVPSASTWVETTACIIGPLTQTPP